jgi:hypothetical protein
MRPQTFTDVPSTRKPSSLRLRLQAGADQLRPNVCEIQKNHPNPAQSCANSSKRCIKQASSRRALNGLRRRGRERLLLRCSRVATGGRACVAIAVWVTGAPAIGRFSALRGRPRTRFTKDALRAKTATFQDGCANKVKRPFAALPISPVRRVNTRKSLQPLPARGHQKALPKRLWARSG